MICGTTSVQWETFAVIHGQNAQPARFKNSTWKDPWHYTTTTAPFLLSAWESFGKKKQKKNEEVSCSDAHTLCLSDWFNT